MLTWALVFFVVAICAASFGRAGVAAGAAAIAPFLFSVFVVLIVASLIVHGARSASRGRPPL